MDAYQLLESGKEPTALRITMETPSFGTGFDPSYHDINVNVGFCFIKDLDCTDTTINAAGFYDNGYADKNKFKGIRFKLCMHSLKGRITFRHEFGIDTYTDFQEVDQIAVQAKAAQALQKKYLSVCKKFGDPASIDEAITYLARVVKANHYFYKDHAQPNIYEVLLPGVSSMRSKVSEVIRNFEAGVAERLAA